MQVPLMDIHSQYAELLDEVKAAVAGVIDSGRFILGPNVRAFEEEVAEATGAAHAVAVANGTDALILGLEALGIGSGDEVICPAHTFYATAEAIARVGATPAFADIDPRTYNINAAAAEAAVTERTRAIVAVHLFGQPADVSALRDVCTTHGLALVEDAAQAFGATRDGRPAGAFGDIATLSFFPTKNLPAMGDAGMVLARDPDVAERVRMLRFHGSHDKRIFEHVGTNSRMDEMQAAILRVLLPHAAGWNAARREAAARYAALGLGDHVGVPYESESTRHVYHLYVVRSAERDALAARLREAGVATAVYYATPLHLQPVFAHLGMRPGDLPETERAAAECLALPMFPTLGHDAQVHVVSAVRAAAAAAA